MHWYSYDNTVPLLNVVKNQIFCFVYNLKLSLTFTLYVEVIAVAVQRDIVINLIQDLKLHITDLVILTLDQEQGL